MNSDYQDQLMEIAEEWTVEQLENFIQKVENRITFNKILAKSLRALRRRKMKNRYLKDTGTRGGK